MSEAIKKEEEVLGPQLDEFINVDTPLYLERIVEESDFSYSPKEKIQIEILRRGGTEQEEKKARDFLFPVKEGRREVNFKNIWGITYGPSEAYKNVVNSNISKYADPNKNIPVYLNQPKNKGGISTKGKLGIYLTAKEFDPTDFIAGHEGTHVLDTLKLQDDDLKERKQINEMLSVSPPSSIKGIEPKQLATYKASLKNWAVEQGKNLTEELSFNKFKYKDLQDVLIKYEENPQKVTTQVSKTLNTPVSEAESLLKLLDYTAADRALTREEEEELDVLLTKSSSYGLLPKELTADAIGHLRDLGQKYGFKPRNNEGKITDESWGEFVKNLTDYLPMDKFKRQAMFRDLLDPKVVGKIKAEDFQNKIRKIFENYAEIKNPQSQIGRTTFGGTLT